MTSRPMLAQCGVLAGLALLGAFDAAADDALRERIHREYRHQSYMLIEDESGARLYLFAAVPGQVETVVVAAESAIDSALRKTRSSDAATRVRGLVELAGAEDPAALDAALSLLTDPSAAVREEAQHLILDHPNGASVARALGLEDEVFEEEPSR